MGFSTNDILNKVRKRTTIDVGFDRLIFVFIQFSADKDALMQF